MRAGAVKVTPAEYLLAALSPGDRLDAALRVASEALEASIFHYQEYTVHECKAYLAARGVVVRV